MNSLYQLGPGLTSQLGPFKTNKGDYPRVRKNPWKGGGVSGGGQLHAGNGNWYTAMTPTPIPARPYTLKPTERKSIVIPSSMLRKPSAGRRIRINSSIRQESDEPKSRPGAPQNTSGHGNNREHEVNLGTENEDIESNYSMDSGQGDNSVSYHMPGEFPMQQQYNTTSEIVAPLLHFPEVPSYSLDHAQDIDNLNNLYSVTSMGELKAGRIANSRDAALDRMSMIAEAPSTSAGNMRQEAQDHIDSLNIELARVIDAYNQMYTLNASNQMENDKQRNEFSVLINQYQSRISELNAQLSESNTRPNPPSSSNNLAEQASFISDFNFGDSSGGFTREIDPHETKSVAGKKRKYGGKESRNVKNKTTKRGIKLNTSILEPGSENKSGGSVKKQNYPFPTGKRTNKRGGPTDFI